MNAPSAKLFSQPVGGYRHLDSFTLATILQIETWRFCQSVFDLRNDPKGRWFDQMTQAARSGRANLIEGSESAATSSENEIRLLGVARASLAELLGDYEMWLAFNNRLPWTKEEAKPAFDIHLDPMPRGDDIVRDSAVHARSQRAKFARWLDDPDSCVRANCLLILVRRAILTIRRQIQGLGDSFAKTGGLREQMTAARLEARARQTAEVRTDSEVPACPKCGRPMRKRIKRDTGEAFWGCTGYAEGCRGTRPMTAGE
ncbi:MAG: four helix bundle suffix domain-containing protein [Kiritimatiellae bacterium]|nr:four helix bundle suffix domain-containing protein [Kiritimatiellia bacterium]